MRRWQVHKFGGALLQTADMYRNVGRLLLRECMGKGADESAAVTPTLAVVSAMGGMTDNLVAVVRESVHDIDGALELLQRIVARQLETLSAVVAATTTTTLQNDVEQRIRQDAGCIEILLRGIHVTRTIPPVSLEVVASYGELWSMHTLCAHLQSHYGEGPLTIDWMDTREIIVVATTGASGAGLGEKGDVASTGGVHLRWDRMQSNCDDWWGRKTAERPGLHQSAGATALVVAAGFVATTESGAPTTLKRSGSDYTATILARLFQCARVTLWKNTNGVYTADPLLVPEAVPIQHLTFDEAMELAYFGAQVLHPSCMVPCIESDIPVYVRNANDPSSPGTEIRGRSMSLIARMDAWSLSSSASSPSLSSLASSMSSLSSSSSTSSLSSSSTTASSSTASSSTASSLPPVECTAECTRPPIKAVTSVGSVSIVTLEGVTLTFGGVAKVTETFMAAMVAAGVSILMITHASSESCISVVIPESQGTAAMNALRRAFADTLAQAPSLSRVRVISDLSIVAIVGEGMCDHIGATATFMGALAAARVNIRFIAQGSSERQVAVVIDSPRITAALQAVHASFFSQPRKKS